MFKCAYNYDGIFNVYLTESNIHHTAIAITNDLHEIIGKQQHNTISLDIMRIHDYKHAIECILENNKINKIIFTTRIFHEHNDIIDMLNHEQIQHLVFDCEWFSIDYMIKQLGNFKHLQTLHCPRSRISNNEVRALIHALRKINITDLYIYFDISKTVEPVINSELKNLFGVNTLQSLKLSFAHPAWPSQCNCTTDWLDSLSANTTIRSFALKHPTKSPEFYNKFAVALAKNKTIRKFSFQDSANTIDNEIIDAVIASGIRNFSTDKYDDVDTLCRILECKKIKSINLDIDDHVIMSNLTKIGQLLETNYYIRYMPDNLEFMFQHYITRNRRYIKQRVFTSLIDFAIVFAEFAFDPYIIVNIFNWYYDNIITDSFVARKIAIAVGIRKSVDKIRSN